MSKKLLVVGGAGALGRGVVSNFARASWGVTSVDFSASEDAHNNVLLPKSNSLKQAEQTLKEISSRYGKVNTVVCTAGGWAGGSIRDADSLINLGEMHSKNLESAFLGGTELPEDSSVLGVLPTTIDTPMNRNFMADADFSTWTKAEDIAEKILEWSNAPYAARPPSGHLITATTVSSTTSWKDVGNSFQ
ncbi:hypothetical protein JG687_00000759 [Phytophthora cactorum]|uniref:NAD(P)-binding domain n=1 Tax=Phytophthora cactorum TaxID=29920 RepID=A0A8T1V1Y6_9STRA|nr:hypothetical protein JG687_00000759 [Phytophthora cactorum]